MLNNPSDCDVVIVGSGIAGLTVAWKLAASKLNKLNIILVTKKERAESNTNYAQGGIAAVMSPVDSFEDHIKDTLIAGDGLCLENIVKLVVTQGPERIKELMELGVKFSQNEDGNFDLGREGGHSKRRVIHAKDLTGREIERALLNYCENFKNLKIHENMIAVDLYKNEENKATGIYVYDREEEKVIAINAKKIVLATGGAGKVYKITSNPNIATGDGIAIAARIGASIANLEFTQFHPTCVYIPQARPSNFLISEALRGEGAKLVDGTGTRFMSKYDDREELAPRDIVARAIDSEIKKSGDECVYLDITHKDPKFLKSRFPGIYESLLKLGIDLTTDKIPVVPAAHYFCGGVIIDINGRTDIENLYAVGEVSCTGLHGANRLASNSLLEAVVFGHNLAAHISDISNTSQLQPIIQKSILLWDESKENNLDPESDDKILISHNWDELRSLVQNYVGIVRSKERLKRAMKRLILIKEEVNNYFNNFKINSDLIELRNLVEVAELIIISATNRKESRGTHYNINYPDHETEVYNSVVQRDDSEKYIYRSKKLYD